MGDIAPYGSLARDQLEQYADPIWRLSHLYRIQDDRGRDVLFVPNGVQRDFLDSLWYLNIVLKARQEGFCLSPETLVLTADLRWVKIGDIQPGQQIVGFDEHIAGGRGNGRKMRAAVVQATRRVVRKSYRITFDDGRSVVCTAQHPWLSRKEATDAQWRTIEGPGKKRLTVGTSVRWITHPWEPSSYEDGWFGGLLDGEGTMRCKPRGGFEVTITQVAGDVLDRAKAYLTERGYKFRVDTDERTPEDSSKFGSQPVYRLVLHRMNEAFRLLGQTRPSRFVKRAWWDGRDPPGKKSGIGWAKIVAIEPLGARELVDLQTSTGTYIAEGFVSHNTTLIDLVILDQCLWYDNVSAGVIAHTVGDALNIFEKKIRYPYRHLPEGLKATKPLVKDAQSDYRFANGSSISVGTSFRSGTLQLLHVSEFGKIAAMFPKKAVEIVTGSFNTIAPGQWIFVESTAEGRGGAFFNMCQSAQQKRDEKRRLTELDFRFHFYPWYRKKSNRINPEGVHIERELGKYFDELERKLRIKLDMSQRAWYQQKRQQNIDAGGAGTLDGESLMKREHPSYEMEAFEAAVAGAYFANEMRDLRKQGRLRPLPIMKNVPVNTFWDIGKRDLQTIWFHQKVGPENRLIDYYENAGQVLEHYARVLQDKGYLYGRHYLPHDAENSTVSSKTVGGKFQSTADQLFDLGVRPQEIVPRVERLAIGIQAMRAIFPSLWIDPVRCANGVVHIDMYRKAWNETVGDWHDHPVEDEHENGADSLRQLAQSGVALKASQMLVRDERGQVKQRSWRTV